MITLKEMYDLRKLCDLSAYPNVGQAVHSARMSLAAAVPKLLDEIVALTQPMPCGHPVGAVSYGTEGTNFCRWCEEVGRLKERLATSEGQAAAMRPQLESLSSTLIAGDTSDGVMRFACCELRADREEQHTPEHCDVLRALAADAGSKYNEERKAIRKAINEALGHMHNPGEGGLSTAIKLLQEVLGASFGL